MTTKHSTLWNSTTCPHYVESADEDDNEYLSTVTTKPFTRGDPPQEDKGSPPEVPVWAAVGDESAELQSSPLRSTLCDKGIIDLPYEDDPHHENSSGYLLSPRQSSLTRTSHESTSVEEEDLADKTLAVVNPRDSTRPFKRAENEGEKKQTQTGKAYFSDGGIEPRVQIGGEKSTASKKRAPSDLNANHRELTSTNVDPREIQFARTEVPLGYYGAWRSPDGTTATAATEWESGTRLGNEAFSVESFSSVLNHAALTVSPNLKNNEASGTATQATYLQTIEKVSPSTANCENPNVDHQSATQTLPQPLAAGYLESLDTAACSAHGLFPDFNLKAPQIHEEVASTLANDFYSIHYHHAPPQYFTPVQQSDSAFTTQPLQSDLLHPFLQPPPSDKSLPLLLPPPSPSSQGCPPSLNPSGTTPLSPRIHPGSLFCSSLPSCDVSRAGEDVIPSNPASPSRRNLPTSCPNSPLFNEPTCESSYCSPAVVRRNRQLREPADSATADHHERNASGEVPQTAVAEEQLTFRVSSASSHTSCESSSADECPAATEAPHLPCFPPRQRSQLVETGDAVKVEPYTREQRLQSGISPDLHSRLHFNNKCGSPINRQTGIFISETEAESDPHNSHNGKGNPPPPEGETGFARGATWMDASRLIKDECLSDGTFFPTKETVGVQVAARAPPSGQNVALDAKKLQSSTSVPASPAVEDEGLPPLLLGRNSLPAPPEERKPHSYEHASTADPTQQRAEQEARVFLPEQCAAGFSAGQREPRGVLHDPNKPQQPDTRSEWTQQVPPLATSPSASEELRPPAGDSASSVPLQFPHQLQQSFHYACPGTVDAPGHLVADSAFPSTHSLSQPSHLATDPQQLRVPQELDTNSFSVVGPPTLLGSYPFAFPNAFWGASRQVTEPATDQVGQQVYGYPNVLPCPLLPSQQPPNLQESDAAAFVAFNCGLPLPPPWLSGKSPAAGEITRAPYAETPPDNVAVGPPAVASTDNLQRHVAPPSPLSPRQLADAGSYIPRMVSVPPLFHGAGIELSLETHTQTGAAHESLSFLPSASGATATALSLPGSGEIYRKAGVTAPRNPAEHGRCSLRLTNSSSRKRRLLPNSAPPESASRDHKDFLLELLACSLEPVKGVHMDRLRKTWVASWLVGKRRVTRIFSFQKFGFFGAREQAIRQRREALLNPELESEEARRVVAAAAAAAAAAGAPNASAACAATAGVAAADTAEKHQSTSDSDRRLVQKIADSLPFVVGVTYHGESSSWIANHRKPMGKIVARRRFSIAEYGFLEARRRAAVMMFHWHKQGRIVEPEDYDQGAAATFNAQQRPQLPDTVNSEGFVYWYPACTANEPLYLMTAFDEESCDEAMVLLASICGNPWKKVCKGQPQGGVEEMFLSGGETAAAARFLSSFHSEGACTNWYLSNSQRRERNNNFFWEGLKKARQQLDADETSSLSPRKRLKCSAVSRKNPHTKKYAPSDVQEAQPLRSLLASPGRGAQEESRKRQSQALCKNKCALKHADEEDDDSCWEAASRSACQAASTAADIVHRASHTKKDTSLSLSHRVLVSSKRRERPGEARKKAVLLRNSFSATRVCSTKESPPFCSSTYWTRRRHAEQRARTRNESGTEEQNLAEKGDTSGGSESSLYRTDTQPHRPDSAQEVLRACFGSEPASARCSAAGSEEVDEAEALTCQPHPGEAHETGHEAEEEDVEEGDEEEEVEEDEDEEEEEPVVKVFHHTGSASVVSAGGEELGCRNPVNSRPPTIPQLGSGQALSQDNIREFNRGGSFQSADPCQKERCDENPLDIQHLGQVHACVRGANPSTQASRLLDSTSWFTNTIRQNVALTQQQQERPYRDFAMNDSVHSTLPPHRTNVSASPPYASGNSPGQVWRAGKKTKQVVCAPKENSSELPSVSSETYQDCAPLLMPQAQLCANTPLECSDKAPLPCRMELVIHEPLSQ